MLLPYVLFVLLYVTSVSSFKISLNCMNRIFTRTVFALLSMYVGEYGGLSESELCVFRELRPIGWLVVDESPPVLLWSVVMSYVDYVDDG